MNSRGSIVFSVLLVLVLTMLGMALLLRSANESALARRAFNSTQALWLAEAGVQRTVWEINYNSCKDFVQQGTSTACTSCTCGSGNKTLAGTISGAGDYDVVLNSSNTQATATGSCPSRTSNEMAARNVQVQIGIKSPFGYAAFAQGKVSLSNNTFVDSYNSNNGAYSVTNSATNGDIGSNGTTAGIIQLNNNVSVGGSLSTGVGGTVTEGSNVDVTGTITNTNNVSLPAVTVPSSLTSLTSPGTLSIGNNGSATLTAGNYKYTSLSMSNNATLNITGGTVNLYLTGSSSLTGQNNVSINVASGATLVLYIDGKLSVDNNVTLSSSGNKPQNIQIYSSYTGSSGVSINNNSALYAAVYAPSTDVSIGNNGDILGSIVGKTVSLSNNAALHYDESLANLNSQVGSDGVTQWKEI